MALGRLLHRGPLAHLSLMRHQPAPPPDHPQGTLAWGGREGVRAGTGSTHLKNGLEVRLNGDAITSEDSIASL